MKSLKSFLWHQLREGSVGFEVLGTVFCVEDALLIWHYSLTTKAKACTSCVQQPLLSTNGLHILQDALPAPVPLCLLLALLSLSLYLSQNDVILSVYLWTFILCSPSLVCAKALLWIVAPWLFCPWDSPGNNTGADCHFLLHFTCLHSVNSMRARNGSLLLTASCVPTT